MLDIFDERAYCAYDFGRAKPQSHVLEGKTEALAVPPREVLFIGNSEEYIADAGSARMQVLFFRGSDMLRVELERRGLLSGLVSRTRSYLQQESTRWVRQTVLQGR